MNTHSPIHINSDPVLDLSSIQMSFDPHVVLNEELPPKKYESYSAPASNYGDTLD